jgi:predicted nucleotide-binding protein
LGVRVAKSKRLIPRKQPSGLKVFVGSSREHEHEALEIASWIESLNAEAILWTEAFPAGTFTLPELVTRAGEVDVAVFVFAQDDVVRSRKTQSWQTRDNVLIE